jgi:hypothetical protein
MFKTLSETDFSVDQDIRQRAVELSSDYSGFAARQLVAHLTPRQIILTRLRHDGKPLRFALTADELSELAAAWALFRREVQSADEAYQQAQDALHDEAYRIAAEIPDIRIVESPRNNDLWDVEVKELDWYRFRCVSCEELLQAVKEARRQLAIHVRWLTEHAGQDGWSPESNSMAYRLIEQYGHVLPPFADEAEALEHPF